MNCRLLPAIDAKLATANEGLKGRKYPSSRILPDAADDSIIPAPPSPGKATAKPKFYKTQHPATDSVPPLHIERESNPGPRYRVASENKQGIAGPIPTPFAQGPNPSTSTRYPMRDDTDWYGNPERQRLEALYQKSLQQARDNEARKEELREELSRRSSSSHTSQPSNLPKHMLPTSTYNTNNPGGGSTFGTATLGSTPNVSYSSGGTGYRPQGSALYHQTTTTTTTTNKTNTTASHPWATTTHPMHQTTGGQQVMLPVSYQATGPQQARPPATYHPTSRFAPAPFSTPQQPNVVLQGFHSLSNALNNRRNEGTYFPSPFFRPSFDF